MPKLKSSLLLPFTFLIAVTCLSVTSESVAAKEKQMGEIIFKSSLDGVLLRGTISKPKIKSKGAVLFLVGSGKVDRDETTPAERTYSGKEEKLFAQLSQTLTEAGFVTFRYDKRGVLGPDGKVDSEIWKTADREHLMSDAADAAKFLMKEEKITAEQLAILGHSEGTIIATETAIAIGSHVRALFLFGAQARSMKDMLHFQIVESRAKQTSGIGDETKPEDEYKKALDMIANSKEIFAPDGKPLAWYRQHLAAPSNADRLKSVMGKKFVFQGIDDPQTPVDEVDRFVKAGVKDIVVFRYPDLGHGFSPDKDGKPTLGPIDRRVLKDLRDSALKL